MKMGIQNRETAKEKRGNKTTRALKKIAETIQFILTGKGTIADEAINAGLVDYSGQGRNKYGR